MRITMCAGSGEGSAPKDLVLALIAPDRCRRRDGASSNARGGDSAARHGRADDGLQHVDRGRRPRRDDRPRRHDLPVPRAAREHAPKAARWVEAVARWRALQPDDDARFDAEVTLDASALEPMITWSTNPAMAVGVTRPIPSPSQARDAHERAAQERALAYMALEPDKPIQGKKIDVVFVGSCTNSRGRGPTRRRPYPRRGGRWQAR